MLDYDFNNLPPKLFTLRKPERCAARCGGNAKPGDIYCQECREEITGEAWLLIEIEEPAHEKA